MSWRPLRLTVEPGSLPPLLISASFTVNSYTVYITDLTYIWSESLDRRGIIKRSLDENTSIDPSEAPDQMRQFLQKLESGIEGAEKTSVKLKAGRGRFESGVADELHLSITAELPAGFQPLEWTMSLAIRRQDILRNQLTMPLIKAQQKRLSELDSLVDLLRDKDHIIQKMIDKIETMGAELGHIFAGAAPKRGVKVSRKWQEERVRGLAPFDVKSWKQAGRDGQVSEGTSEDMETINNVFNIESGNDLGIASDFETSVIPGPWWNKLKDLPQNKTTAVNRTKRSTQPSSLPKEPTEAAEEEDFQVQSTPPHLTDIEGRQRVPSENSVAYSSTDDEDNLDSTSQSQRSIVQDSYQVSHSKPTAVKKLGTIGGKPKPKAKSKTPEPPPAAASMIVDDSSATEDEDEPRPAPNAPSPQEPPAQPSAKPKTSGLGKIGGKRQAPTPTPESTGQDDTMPAERAPHHKLGIIGHAQSPVKHGEASLKREAGQEAGSAGAAPEPDETAEEKANRKRLDLKRELEAKAKAPAKKKRKF